MVFEEESIENTYDNVVSSLGATLVISLVFFSSWATDFLPEGVLISLGVFFGLPLAFDFIFGIIFNKPNFSVRRRYGFLSYILLTLVLYFYFITPTSVTEAFFLSLQYLVGFLLALVSGLTYLGTFKLFKSKIQYRIKASVAFAVSFTMTYLLIFALKYLEVLSWLA